MDHEAIALVLYCGAIVFSKTQKSHNFSDPQRCLCGSKQD